MSRADLSDGEIKESLNKVKNGKLSWFMIGHVPKSDNKYKVTASGMGGIEELKGELNDGKVQFAFIAVDLSGVRKFVFISWCGEGVTGLKKGYFNGHSQDVAAYFTGFHVQVNARNEDDINNDGVLSRVKKATGASFYQQHKAQDTESTPTPSNIKYERGSEDQSTENKPVASTIKYERPKDDQSTENTPMPSNIRYDRPRYDQSTENKPLASRFPGAQQTSKPAPSKPAPSPAKSAPPVQSTPPAKPPPAPKPSPVQQVQEEPPVQETQQEYGEEQQYTEEQQYGEEAQGGNCRALYDYEGEKEGDLSFKEGDIIAVLDKSDPSGWWQGSLNGVTGYFPMNFVEEC